eukprot:12493746-Ditylum_brightwellii.AAC.1
MPPNSHTQNLDAMRSDSRNGAKESKYHNPTEQSGGKYGSPVDLSGGLSPRERCSSFNEGFDNRNEDDNT